VLRDRPTVIGRAGRLIPAPTAIRPTTNARRSDHLMTDVLPETELRAFAKGGGEDGDWEASPVV
jgi:hypothetical protein